MKDSGKNKVMSLLAVLLIFSMLSGCAAPGQNGTQTAGAPAVTETSADTSADKAETTENTAATAEEVTEASTESAVNENGLAFTQTENVGVCTQSDTTGYKEFRAYMKVAEAYILTPGLNEHLVPQGMDQHAETGNIYMSGYIKKGEFNVFDDSNPTAVVMMNAEGELKAEYVMYYADGTGFDSHMGGVAVSDDTLFVSATKGKDAEGNATYWIAAIPLADLVTEGHQDVYLETFYQVPVQPSWLNYSNDTLWVGNFYLAGNESYAAPVTIGTTYAETDKETCASYILGYDLTELGVARMETAEGEPAMPDADKVYCTTERIQGMTMLCDGRIVLSQSYGRANNSQLMVYDPAEASTQTISIDGNEYTCIMLEKKTCRDELYVNMPMSEGITVKTDGSGLEVLVLYESGAVLYSGDGTYDKNAGKYRTDYIWKVAIPEK